MNRMALAWFTPALVFALALGCGGDSDDASTAADATASAGDGDSGGDGDGGDGDGDVPVLANIDGVVTDSAGAPLGMAGIQFCGPVSEEGAVEACKPVPVDADTGTFSIEVTKLGFWNLKAVHAPEEGRYFTGQAIPLTVAMDDMISYPAPGIVVPEVNEVIDLSAATGEATFEVGAGIWLTFDPAMTQTPSFTPAAEMGAIEVPEAEWQITEVPDAGPVIAAWTFHPFGTKLPDASFGLAVESGLGLAAGEAVQIFEVEKDNAFIHKVADAVVSSDGTHLEITPTAEGLHELTWLLFTQ